MKFGIFDHMDRGAAALGRQYEDRLELIEAYDRHGFHAYHLAEHHATPLGMAPSPSVFLAAVAQRTRRLRFGPLVYTLGLYHPLRLIEEICMLDQMSGGRLELGIGRGISAHEIGYYGVDPAEAQARYVEALAVVLRGLTSRTLDFEGAYYRFHGVPIELEPAQRPHPPLWYGVARPESTVWTAAHKINIVCNAPTALVRQITDRYRREWGAAGNDPAAIPLLGMSRHLIVAESDGEALDIARRAYTHWFRNFNHLWEKHGTRPQHAAYPSDLDEARRIGYVVAGSARTVRDTLLGQVAEAGNTYLVGRFAFGDLSFRESTRSIELFTQHIMPALLAEAA